MRVKEPPRRTRRGLNVVVNFSVGNDACSSASLTVSNGTSGMNACVRGTVNCPSDTAQTSKSPTRYAPFVWNKSPLNLSLRRFPVDDHIGAQTPGLAETIMKTKVRKFQPWPNHW